MSRRDFGSILTRTVKVDGRNVKRYLARIANPKYGSHPEEPQRLSRTFDRHSDAAAYLREIAGQIQRGEWLSPREEKLDQEIARQQAAIAEKTFSEYAARWFTQKDHKPSTATAYRKYYENHLEPYWGSTPLRSITTPLVMEWVAEHLSPNRDGARRKSYELFRAILNDAVLDELIDSLPCNKRTNQLAKRKTHESTRHNERAIKAEEVYAIVNAMPKHERLFTLIMGVLGLRLGEARELRRRDFDLDAGIVYLHRGVTGDGKDRATDSPKSPASKRPVALSPELVTLLGAHFEEQGKRPANALVFPSSTGTDRYINESTYRTHLKKACELVGIERITAHDLRRTAVTLALQVDGVSVRDVQALVGHTTPNMTMHYARTNDQQQQRIAEGVSAAVLNATPLNVTPLRKAL